MIDMNYEGHTRGVVTQLFRRIRLSMVKQGFEHCGRHFSIDLPAEHATSLARYVLEELDTAQGIEERSIFHYITAFYGFELSERKNLLTNGGLA